MLNIIATKLWGQFDSRQEIKKFVLLGIIFGLIVGVGCVLSPIKDSIFASLVGIDYQPWAKVLSLFFIAPIVVIYGKLVDIFPRHRVFYAVTIFYGLLALLFAYFFMHPVIGLANVLTGPARILGWLWYVYVESLSSIVVALFWAFTTDITEPEAAKRGFPLIVLFGQFGIILGPFLLTAKRLGFGTSAPIVAIAGILMMATALLMRVFVQTTPASELVGFDRDDHKERKSQSGFFEGLRLLLTHRYLLGIFLIVSIHKIISTIMDFQFKSAASVAYPVEKDLASFLANYFVLEGIVAMLCILFVSSIARRYFGMTWSLALLPIVISIAVVSLWMNPALSVLFWIMVFSRAINYALNQPVMKQLYIPTSKDAKYKSQAWIEMFGSRGSKAAGSAINMFRGTLIGQYGKLVGMSMFLNASVSVSLLMIIVWIFTSLFVARKYTQAVKEHKSIC